MEYCFNCKKRSVGCHVSCDDYKKFKQELEEKAVRKREVKSKENIINDAIMAGIRKRYKKYGQKKW